MSSVMKRAGPIGRGMRNLHLKTEEDLYVSYLSFLKNGGLFIPSEDPYQLGAEVFVLVSLPGQVDKVAVAGKVAWINPKNAQNGRPQGIGIQFGEGAGNQNQVRAQIEAILAAKLKSEARTYTM